MVNVWVTLTYTFLIDYFLLKDKIIYVGFNSILRGKMHGCNCTKVGSKVKELYCRVSYITQARLGDTQAQFQARAGQQYLSKASLHLFAGGGFCLQFVKTRTKTKQP